MDRIKQSWPTLLICVLLSTVTLAVFCPVFHYDIIYYDDPQYVTENPHVLEGLTWPNLKWAMTAVCAGNWHPLTLLSHMVDVQLFGLKIGWHHLVNLLLHTANSLLLFLLLKRMTGAIWRSAFVAALFALHPLHVESVAWVAERKDVLSAFFFMLTLGAYARYVDAQVRSQVPSLESQVSSWKPSDHTSPITFRVSRFTFRVSRFYVLALAFFLLGLMTKPMLVTLPFVLLLLDYWPLGRWRFGAREGARPPDDARATSGGRLVGDLVPSRAFWRLVREKTPFFALSAASCIITFLAQRSSGAVSSLDQVAFEKRFGNAMISCLAYLKQAFWPADMAIIYPYPAALPDAEVAAAALLLCGICVAAVLLLRRWPYLAVGWFWFVGMLVPVIGLVQVGEQARADRYTYLPLIGIFIIVAWSVPALVTQIFNLLYRRFSTCWVSNRAGSAADCKSAIQQIKNLRYEAGPAPGFCSAALVAAGIAVLAALGCTAHTQVQYWRNTYTLFEHAARVTEENYAAFQGVGIALLHQGDYSEAMTNLTRALELAQARGTGAGIKYYIGAALQLQGKGVGALPYLREAIVGPDLIAERNCRLGVCLIEAGQMVEGEAAIRDALAVKPDLPDARLAMAGILQMKGHSSEAEAVYREVIHSQPTLPQAHRTYADFLMLEQRPGEAEGHYERAVTLAKPDATLLRNYAAALSRQHMNNAAVTQLERALALAPTDPDVNFELAELLSEQGQKSRALVCYDAAIEAKPDFITALNNCAWMLATDSDERLRSGNRAVELAERACRLTGWKAAVLMGTLAAAYAEAGRFSDAVQMAERARDKARTDRQEAVAKRNEELLELYRAGKPYREAPGAR